MKGIERCSLTVVLLRQKSYNKNEFKIEHAFIILLQIDWLESAIIQPCSKIDICSGNSDEEKNRPAQRENAANAARLDFAIDPGNGL
jgi:hypothetical protein